MLYKKEKKKKFNFRNTFISVLRGKYIIVRMMQKPRVGRQKLFSQNNNKNSAIYHG